MFCLFLALSAQAHHKKHRMRGLATHYGAWHHGKVQASGEPFDMHKKTCAHRTLRMGTRLKITVLRGKYRGNTTSCVVMDRGPYGAYLNKENSQKYNGTDKVRVRFMGKRQGVWKVKYWDKSWGQYKEKPGEWRGAIDMSLATARSLQGIEDGRPNNFFVKLEIIHVENGK